MIHNVYEFSALNHSYWSFLPILDVTKKHHYHSLQCDNKYYKHPVAMCFAQTMQY